MQSKKMKTIIKRIKTLNKEELERLSNVVEAEIIFRDETYINKVNSFINKVEENV